MIKSFPINGVGAKSWFKNNMESKQYTHTLNADSVVFDLGAYTGTYTDNIHKRYKCNIYAFEPVGKFYNVLKSKYANIPKVRTLQYGLGPKDDEMTLYLSGKATSNVSGSGASHPVNCNIVQIDKFMNENSITHIDLMAINIEGGEYELLEHMKENDLFKNVKMFQIQFHDFPRIENRHLRRLNIQNELNKTHKLVYNYEFCWEKWERR